MIRRLPNDADLPDISTGEIDRWSTASPGQREGPSTTVCVSEPGASNNSAALTEAAVPEGEVHTSERSW